MRQFRLQLHSNALARGLDQPSEGVRRNVFSSADPLGQAVVVLRALDEAIETPL